MSPYKEISQKRLKFAYWLVLNREKLKKVFLLAFIVFDLIIWVFVLFHFTQILISSKEFNQMLKGLTQLPNYEESRQRRAPLIPEILMTKAIPAGRSISQPGKFNYHLISLIKNPNPKWHLRSLTYRFVFEGGASNPMTTFVLPMTERYLVSFDEALNSPPAGLNLETLGLEWARINPSLQSRLEILNQLFIKEPRHFSVFQELLPNVKAKDRTVFYFVNDTFHNFWQIDLLVILLQGREIVAVNKNILRKILDREERKVEIVWPDPLSFVSEIKVQPEINVFDDSVFMPRQMK